MSKLGPKSPGTPSTSRKPKLEKLTVEDLGQVSGGRALVDDTCKTARTEDICSFGSGECDGKCPS